MRTRFGSRTVVLKLPPLAAMEAEQPRKAGREDEGTSPRAEDVVPSLVGLCLRSQTSSSPGDYVSSRLKEQAPSK